MAREITFLCGAAYAAYTAAGEGMGADDMLTLAVGAVYYESLRVLEMARALEC